MIKRTYTRNASTQHAYPEPSISVREIADLLAQQVERFAPELMGEKAERMGNTLRFGTCAALSIFRTGPKRGKWMDFESNTHGDMIDLIQHRFGCTPAEAIQTAKGMLGISDAVPLPPMPHIPTESAEDDAARRVKVATWIWESATPIGTRATTAFPSLFDYIEGRGLAMEPSLRARRLTAEVMRTKMKIDTTVFGDRDADVLIFPMTLPDGTLRAVQQVLVLDGKKLPTAYPKRTNGVPEGAAIRFGQGKVVLVCEGPETGMALHQATGLSVCVATGRSMLSTVQFAPSTTGVVLAQDDDAPGRDAAHLSIEAYLQRGLRARSILPTPVPGVVGPDFNDVYKAYGAEHIIDLLRATPVTEDVTMVQTGVAV